MIIPISDFPLVKFFMYSDKFFLNMIYLLLLLLYKSSLPYKFKNIYLPIPKIITVVLLDTDFKMEALLLTVHFLDFYLMDYCV